MKKLLFCASIALAAYPLTVGAANQFLAPTSLPFITKNLQLRSVGQEVVILQKFLLKNELLPVPAPTGYFGQLTEKAVKAWQVDHRISPTGTVGPITRAAINIKTISEAIAGSPSETPEDSSNTPPVAAGGNISLTETSRTSASSHTNAPPVVIDYPTVASVYPADGSSSAKIDRGIAIFFSDDMDPSTLNSATVQVSANGSAQSGAFVYQTTQKALVFYPYSRWASNARIGVALSKEVKDTAGIGLKDPYSFSFSTGSDVSNVSTISLRSTASYGLIISSASSVGQNTVTGNIASSASLPSLTVYGDSHSNDAVAAAVRSDAELARMDLDMYACDSVSTGAIDIGGSTFGSGTYCYQGPVAITGTTTLSGPGDHVFKFQSSLTTSATSSVVVTNGANPNGVFWDVRGGADLRSSSKLLGTLFVDGAVALGNGSRIDGRVLAQASAVSLASTTVTVPGSVYCSTAVPVHRRTMTAFQTHNGGNPTAAYIATDGTTVTGEVDAKSCDFGVYVPPNSTVTIRNAIIHDANQAGVFNDGAAVTVSTSTIYNTGDHVNDGLNGGAFSLGGTQTGFAIYVATSSTGMINGNTIYNYQKAGILMRVLDGVVVRNNSITGAGTTTQLAQIGVQFGFPDPAVSSTTIGNFTGNTVTANIYGPSAAAAGVFGSLFSGEDANLLMAIATSTNSLFGNQEGQDVAFQ